MLKLIESFVLSEFVWRDIYKLKQNAHEMVRMRSKPQGGSIFASFSNNRRHSDPFNNVTYVCYVTCPKSA